MKVREHICIQFDECKPHWARQRGYLTLAEGCELTEITLGGDPDSKTALIFGYVEDFVAFEVRINATVLSEGTLCRVGPVPVPGGTKPRYSIEIDCMDRECDRFEPRWSNYGLLIAEGDTLEQLLDSAAVDAMDQDGGELWCGPADEDWMQEAVELAFWKAAEGLEPAAFETFGDFASRARLRAAARGSAGPGTPGLPDNQTKPTKGDL